MYMMTKSKKTNIPLIKLSEGSAVEGKGDYVTIVAGSNGEKIRPVTIWKTPFLFFNKELLNAEFVSKTELNYVRATFCDNKENIKVEIVKYKIPDYIKNNVELEKETICKIKPVTEQILSIKMSYNDFVNRKTNTEWLHFVETLYDNKFKDTIVSVLDKLENPNGLYYYKE